MGNIRASVAMAVCNGEKYIKSQINSILDMMGPNDEIVISYDKSRDNTLEIIKKYEEKDNRIRVVFDQGKSVESNFNNAVKNCKGRYVFLSDQDDVWINNKIEIFVEVFEKNPDVVVVIGDGFITDSNLGIQKDLFDSYHTSSNAFRNFVKGTYLGCQMAFRSSIKNKVFPVRTNPPLPHDLWLGVMGSRYGKIVLNHEKTIEHRLHDENYSNTSKMKALGIVENRILFAKEVIERVRHNKKQKEMPNDD